MVENRQVGNEIVYGGNVALKLDMAKVHDRVAWLYLTKVSKAFGFEKRRIDRVWRLISNISFFVIINGAPVGFFHSTQGLRQGDLLSPTLFIIWSRCIIMYFK